MLSIVIPCFNEGEKLKENIKKIQKSVENIEHEIICVNDGSTDNTKQILEKIEGIKFLSYNKNHGKGYAVKYGITHSSGDKVLFMDADLSTDLSAIKTAIKIRADIVIGSRTQKESVVIGKTWLRNLSSYVSNLIVRAITGVKYKDTQCGFKMFTREAADTIVSKQTIERWSFDVEYLYIAKLNEMSVKEIPVIWENDSDSRVNLVKDSIKFLQETIKIKRNKKLYYN